MGEMGRRAIHCGLSRVWRRAADRSPGGGVEVFASLRAVGGWRGPTVARRARRSALYGFSMRGCDRHLAALARRRSAAVTRSSPTRGRGDFVAVEERRERTAAGPSRPALIELLTDRAAATEWCFSEARVRVGLRSYDRCKATRAAAPSSGRAEKAASAWMAFARRGRFCSRGQSLSAGAVYRSCGAGGGQGSRPSG